MDSYQMQPPGNRLHGNEKKEMGMNGDRRKGDRRRIGKEAWQGMRYGLVMEGEKRKREIGSLRQ
jgi:hypothetical protein